MQINKLGEFGLIEKIARSAAVSDPQVVKAIGDDAAVVSLDRTACLLVTTDILKEGIHFKKAFSSPFVLGKKCLAVNLSDIAAMGGTPRYYFVSLAIPPDTQYGFIRELYRGMNAQARRFGVQLLGGDTTASQDSLVVSITLLGRAVKRQVLYRHGAGPGDLIFVTGTLGDSALGLMLLEKGVRPAYNVLVKRHSDPQPRIEAGRALACSGAASAMMDISDGLAGDLRHIMKQSGVGARIFLDRLPLSAAYRRECPKLSADWYLPALSGGEDYELLFTVPRRNEKRVQALAGKLRLPMTCIGEITDTKQGFTVLDERGKRLRLRETGFRHF
ncbi:MAG: thiamine-phosphate kinase [Deltaproteobacteria bacterium]|nr:thiamine-phosphate kinase [Deltaproteobacteria bacterium]